MHLTLDPLTIITTLGYIGIFAIVFAESGLFFGFFFPGDSLLFTAGLLAANGTLNLTALLILLPLAAVVGDTAGYAFGKWIGPRIFTKEDSFFFNKRHIERSEMFYKKYGAKALVLARFVPIVRTFVPIVAGVGRMAYSTFIIFNSIGALLWGLSITLLGYFLGNAFPATEHYLTPILLLIVFVSILPIAREIWLAREKS
ncbi:MAG TPA: VTT domain-containing protein [Candidatus Paceibacterota bacterium]|jgi:membrane-associated protein|nr:VTT domain-containing protein [Candidatus Paceibacterota bacterium]